MLTIAVHMYLLDLTSATTPTFGRNSLVSLDVHDLPQGVPDLDKILGVVHDHIDRLVGIGYLVKERIGVPPLDAPHGRVELGEGEVLRAAERLFSQPAPCGEEFSASRLPLPRSTQERVPMEARMRPGCPSDASIPPLRDSQTRVSL
jgi:hypothetical protein